MKTRTPSRALFGAALITSSVAIVGIVESASRIGDPGGGALAAMGAIFAGGLLWLAWGLGRARPWAWTAAVLVHGVNALFALAAMIAGDRSLEPVATLAGAAATIALLSRGSVRRAIGTSSPRRGDLSTG